MLRRSRRLMLPVLWSLAGALLLALGAARASAQTLCQEDPTMCEAPTVRFAPGTGQTYAGTTSTQALQVTIHWCSNSPMQAATREIRFNGTLVTTQFSYTTGAYSGCGGVHASSTGTVQLRAGSNTLAGYITNMDGLEGAGTAVYAYSYTAPPAPTVGVVVTPDAGTQRVADSLPTTIAFQVANTGTGTATFAVAAVCTGSGVSACAPSRSSVSVPGGESAPIGVTLRAGAAGSAATVQLTAWKSDASVVRDSGSVAVTVANEPAAGSVGEVEVQVAVARGLCLTASIGEATAYECADLRAAHDLPTTRILNRSRAPTLLYNSQHARPVPVVGATVSPPAGTTPDSVKAVLTVGGTARASGAWGGWAGGTSRRITLGFAATDLTTGVYDYTLTVSTKKAGAETALTSRAGRLIVVDRSASPFGRGWWLAGLEQVKPLGGGQLLWVGGDGSAKLYTPTGQPGRWTAAALTRPDTLKADADVTNPGGWVRELPGGARVIFNAVGQHVRTWNTLGHYTEFVWSGTRLAAIRLSRTAAFSTGYEYTFEYGPNGILSRVVAPYARVAGDRAVAVASDGLGQVTAITDPDATTVTYAYNSATPGVLTRRTNRLGVPTDYGYDPLQRVVRVDTDRDSTPGITTVFTPQETLGRPGTPAVAPASLVTTVDGPRTNVTDVTDVTTFRLDRFGAPVQVTDALGASTKVVRGDERFPALVTYARSASGAERSAVFDARGNLVVSTEWGRAAGVATSLYEWDPKWDELTRITSPTGITTRIAYDPATGQRTWEQTGQDTARRVRFTYRPLTDAAAPGLVESVRTAAAAGRGEQPQRVEYDARGNLRATITPMGIRSEVHSDRIGRDTLSTSPDAPSTRTVYSIADEVLETVTIGGRDTLRVENTYDAEGQTLATTRRMQPDSARIGAMTLRWRYDRVGRQRAAIDVYGNVDSLQFNPAGLVTARITRRRTEQGETAITMRYDALGRMVEKITPSLLYARRDFTAFGHDWRFPSRTLDPDITSSERRIPGDTVRFTYDLAGNLRAADNRYARIRRTYNVDGSLATDSLRTRSYTGQDFDAHQYALAYQYDLEGRRSRLTLGSGLASRLARDHVLYGYEVETGNLATVHDLAGNAYGFRYDADGRLVGRDMPGWVTATNAYDADGMLSSYGISRDTLPNAAGGVEMLLGDALTRDSAGRVTQSNAGPWRFTYNGMGALATSDMWVKDGDEHSAMVLDALGNVLSDRRKVRDETVSDWPTEGTRTYSYDRAGRQSSMEGRQRIDNELTEQAGWFYDAAGNRWWYQEGSRTGDNRTAQERTHSYYDAEDRLWAVDRQRCHTQVINPTGGQYAGPPICGPWQEQLRQDPSAFEEYRYDALGRRVLVRRRLSAVNGTCTWSCQSGIERLVWDGDQIVAEIRSRGGDGAALERDDDGGNFYGRVLYTHGPGIDAPLAVHRIGLDGSTSVHTVIPHANWRGQYQTATFDDGSLSKGGLGVGMISLPGSTMNGYMKPVVPQQTWNWMGSLLTSQKDASGTLYRRNRHYDPATGRFTQEDPIGLAGGLNLYGFGGSDQVNYHDPYGLTGALLLIGAVVEAASTVYDVVEAGRVILRPTATVAQRLVAAGTPLLGTVTPGPGTVWVRGAKRVVSAVRRTDNAADAARGGTYMLRHPGTQQVMRTGRTNNHARRSAEHARGAETRGLEYRIDSETDNYAAQRGREQIIHDQHNPPLNRQRPISPTNRRREEYMQAGEKVVSQ